MNVQCGQAISAKAGWQKVRSGFCLKASENKKREHDADGIKTHRALMPDRIAEVGDGRLLPQEQRLSE
jgi:hypothetical protein